MKSRISSYLELVELRKQAETLRVIVKNYNDKMSPLNKELDSLKDKKTKKAKARIEEIKTELEPLQAEHSVKFTELMQIDSSINSITSKQFIRNMDKFLNNFKDLDSERELILAKKSNLSKEKRDLIMSI